MKRLSLVTLLLLGGALGAHAADNDVYNNISKYRRGDDVLQADTSTCSQLLGAPQSGTPTPREYKRCMLSRGWRYSPHRARSLAGRHVSRPRQSRPDMQGFCRRRHHRIELLEFLSLK
jgi:hypothetical protein